ncbi:SprT-like family-domain-containing protein [Schizophyllum commune]
MSGSPRKPLRKSSSLVLNEPDPAKLKAKATRVFPNPLVPKGGGEEVPDSEEERLNYRSETETEESEAEVARTIKYVSDVIEISSDEEEEEEPRCAPNPTTPKKKYTLGGLGKPTVRQGSPSKGREFSITSHGSDEEIVESEPEAEPRVTKFLPLFLDDSDEEKSVVPREGTAESDDEWDDSEAILHVDTAKAKRTLKRPVSISPTRPSPFPSVRPIDPFDRLPTTSQPTAPSTSKPNAPSTSKSKPPIPAFKWPVLPDEPEASSSSKRPSHSDKDRSASPSKSRPASPFKARTASPDKDSRSTSPSKSPTGLLDKPSRSTSPTKRPPSPRKPTQKALREAEAARRAAYAQETFTQLNAQVFKGGLPPETPLVWNAKMTSTAGRARYHRNSEGQVVTCIELATKILDRDERIRYTLAHEMCHLATWIIDKDLASNHDKLFWKWGRRVMAKRSDIEISTTHSYEINHKYRWQCCNTACGKIFGRFSKSIKVETQFCGCGGKLEPLFTTRSHAPRDPDTPRSSRQAVARGQGGSAVKRTVEVGVKKSTSASIASKTMPGGVIDLCDSGDEDSEDGIEIVTESLGKTTIV